MRRVSLALLLLLVFASAATGVRVHASTDCERWISEYKNELAQSDLAKRAAAAGHRLHRYVHRKVVKLTTPNPRPKIRARVLPARLERPKMTREETLRELEFACGELPVEPIELKEEVAYNPRPVLGPRLADGDADSVVGPFSLAQDGPQNLLASNNGSSSGGAPGFGGIPGFGGGGGGGIPSRGGNTGGGNPGGGGTPSTGSGGDNPPGDTGGSNPPPPPDGPPTAVAPEPGSLLLVATGIAGVAGALRRRVRAA